MARRTGATARALRYYESLGLVKPTRLANGYRSYSDLDVELVRQIQELTALGLRVRDTEPFLECLRLGHEHGDDCVSSLAGYRRAITMLDDHIEQLVSRRDALQRQLDTAAERGIDSLVVRTDGVGRIADRTATPSSDAPTRLDLAGAELPDLTLPATSGGDIHLRRLDELTVLYAYPMTGRPGVDLPAGWDSIPGARGCTAEACGFRDHHAELRSVGVGTVFGLSSQDTDYQREMTARLGLPFPVLSDPSLQVARSLGLPTFEADGMELYVRLTLLIRRARVVHWFHPVNAPSDHAAQLVEWIRRHGEPARSVSTAAVGRR
ncbi:MAG: redoxin domain-containing protein [Nocardioidaceae bacterium]